jgi:hypothetical protein
LRGRWWQAGDRSLAARRAIGSPDQREGLGLTIPETLLVVADEVIEWTPFCCAALCPLLAQAL